MTKIAPFPNENLNGSFKRQKSLFRDSINIKSIFRPEKDRYHLYLSYACPWAHGVLMVLTLKKLQTIVSKSFVNPIRDKSGWKFGKKDSPYFDYINDFRYLSEAYKLMDSNYDMRVTVPVLWDKKTNKIVNNESLDIVIMLNDEFFDFDSSDIDLYPINFRNEIDEVNKYIYKNINNGVYKCGFAIKQEIYDYEVNNLFIALDVIDKKLSKQKYLVGDTLTLSDIRLFATLIRFDLVYYNHFKTNIKHIYEYEHLWSYVKSIYHLEDINRTINFHEIKIHYFMTHPTINPSLIVPSGPDIEQLLKH